MNTGRPTVSILFGVTHHGDEIPLCVVASPEVAENWQVVIERWRKTKRRTIPEPFVDCHDYIDMTDPFMNYTITDTLWKLR